MEIIIERLPVPLRRPSRRPARAAASASIALSVADPQRRARWALRLNEAGYETCPCLNGDKAAGGGPACRRHALVLADASMLRAPLSEAIDLLRQSHAKAPIILLSPENPPPDDVVLFLESGADDVVSESLDPKIVLAKVRAYLRRLRSPERPNAPLLDSPEGRLRLDTRARRVYVKADAGQWRQLPKLTPSETQVLSQFLRSPGVIFDRRTLMEAINAAAGAADDAPVPLPNLVDKHIQTLRKKLSREGLAIQSVYGQGYVYVEKI